MTCSQVFAGQGSVRRPAFRLSRRRRQIASPAQPSRAPDPCRLRGSDQAGDARTRGQERERDLSPTAISTGQPRRNPSWPTNACQGLLLPARESWWNARTTGSWPCFETGVAGILVTFGDDNGPDGPLSHCGAAHQRRVLRDRRSDGPLVAVRPHRPGFWYHPPPSSPRPIRPNRVPATEIFAQWSRWCLH